MELRDNALLPILASSAALGSIPLSARPWPVDQKNNTMNARR